VIGGKEYDNTPFLDFFLTQGIYFRKSSPHTKQTEWCCKRNHRHIVEIACTMLIEAQMPYSFWHDVVLTAIYVIN